MNEIKLLTEKLIIPTEKLILHPERFYTPIKDIKPFLITKELQKYLKSLFNKRHKLSKSESLEELLSHFNYSLLETDDNCSGWCDVEGRRIALNYEVLDKVPKEEKYQTICHELGHAIQNDCGLWLNKDNFTLSQEIYTEQQAETISFYLADILFPNENKKKMRFDAYFHEDDFLYLEEWYNGDEECEPVQNDLFIKNSEYFEKEEEKEYYRRKNLTDEELEIEDKLKQEELSKQQIEELEENEEQDEDYEEDNSSEDEESYDDEEDSFDE